MEAVAVNGLRITEGTLPLVVLPGWPLNGRTWRRQVGLSQEFMVVACDATGTGRSPDPPETLHGSLCRRLL